MILIVVLASFFSCKKACKEGSKIGLNRTAKIFNDSLLVCSTLSDSVVIEDVKSRKLIFSKRINDSEVIRPQPVLDKKNRLYAVFSEDNFSCIDIKTNLVKWTYTAQQKINVIKWINDSLVIIGIRGFGLVALNAETGKMIYELPESNSSTCSSSFVIGFTFDKERIYISDFQCNTIAAYNLVNGKKIWGYQSSLFGVSRLLICNNYIFCGITGDPMKYEGKILLLDKNTGLVLAEENKDFDLITAPILFRNNIIYYTYDSEELNEFNIENRKSKLLYKFNSKDALCGSQLHFLNNYIYFDDCGSNVMRLNLRTKRVNKIEKARKGITEIYRYKNEVKFVY